MMTEPANLPSLEALLAAHKAGQFDMAEQGYRRILAADPDDLDANHLLGVLCQQTGRLAESRTRLEAVLARSPDLATAHNNLGITIQAEGDWINAMAAYRTAIAMAPTYVEARHNLALLATEQEDYSLAEEQFRQALITAPRMPELHLGLGNCYLNSGHLSAAMTAYQTLLEINPDHAIGHNNIGMIFARIDQPHAALVRYERTLTLDPGYAEARWNRARLKLLIGDWVGGWTDFEARRQAPKFRKTMYHPPSPVWQGEPIAGKTLLLHAEQGRGDSIQFVRWARSIADRGASVILDVEEDLTALFASHDPRVTVLARSPNPPCHDLNCPLPSLPAIFAATPATMPQPPYLSADPERRRHWAPRLETPPGTLKIGLVWAGNPEFSEDRQRSPRLPPFLPLLAEAGCHFFGLQVGRGREDLAGQSMPSTFTDLGADLQDYADTAAVMAELDLIISACTSPAHLAGALGRPVWIALSYVADWRWMRATTESPWYPTARLYRQPRPGDWASVIQAMIAELRTGLKP